MGGSFDDQRVKASPGGKLERPQRIDVHLRQPLAHIRINQCKPANGTAATTVLASSFKTNLDQRRADHASARGINYGNWWPREEPNTGGSRLTNYGHAD